jgi:nifR3 family TIM-barrel protein
MTADSHNSPAPLTLGRWQLQLPVVQAALSGYSDWAMRALARECGAPYTIAEVVIDKFVTSLRDRQRTRHHLYVTDADHPCGAQLMGAEPETFGPAALRLVEAGFDVIDINFGCPARKASGRCRGGYHLGQPAVAVEILQRVLEAVPSSIPVTVKMRRGLDDSEESREHFFRILEAASNMGIAAATIHGRTVEQKYVGPSRWDFLREVRRTFPRMTLLGSGDLFTAADCVRMLRETGMNGVTAARGAIGNPWIFGQAAALLRGEPLPAAPSVFAQRRLIERHYELAVAVLPAEQVLRTVRRFCLFYAAWHPRSIEVRNAFVRVPDESTFRGVLDCWYSMDEPGRYPENPENKAAMDEG